MQRKKKKKWRGKWQIEQGKNRFVDIDCVNRNVVHEYTSHAFNFPH